MPPAWPILWLYRAASASAGGTEILHQEASATDKQTFARAPRERGPHRSSEGEDVRADAGIVERDLERPLAAGGADQLVHPRLVDGAVTALADVEPAAAAGRLAVEPHGEARRRV